MNILRYALFLVLSTCSVLALETTDLEIVRECDCYRWKFGGGRLYKELQGKLLQMGRCGVGSRIVSGVPKEERYWEKYEVKDTDMKKSMFSNPSSFPQIFQNYVVLYDLIQLSHDCSMEGLRQSRKQKKFKQEFFDERFLSETDLTTKAYRTHNEYQSKIVNEFVKMKCQCLRTHISLQTLFNAGLADISMGNFQEAMQSASYLIESAIKSHQEDVLTVEHYQNLGLSCLECMKYAEAIQALSEVISYNPSNKEPYFLRAVAYFETGNFENAIQDFVNYRNEKVPLPPLSVSAEFVTGLTKGLKNGVQEAAVDFVPTLCLSAYGIGQCLWAFSHTPIESSANFFNACYETGETVVQAIKELDQEMLEDLAAELHETMLTFDKLGESEKGEVMGYSVGRYGVDIFAGVGAMKGIAAFKKLKDANRLCNIEALAISNAEKEVVIAGAVKHAMERDFFSKMLIITLMLTTNIS